MRFLLLLFTVMLSLPSFGQSLWRNFFTTNQNPIVDVVAGSNATVQATTVGANLRRFTVNSTATGSGSGQTNWPASAITNAPWQYGSPVLTNLASLNGGALTNVPFTIWTNYTSNPNDYTNLNGLAFGQGIYGMTSFWAYAIAPGIGPIGIYYSGIDTNTVITTNGGAFAGTILDNSVTSLAPINNQLVTAQWVRSLFAGAGVSYYASTNVAIGLTNADAAGAFVFTYQTNIPVYDRRIYANPAVGSYIGAVAVTNRLLQLNAGVTVNAYIELTGIGSATATVKPEIYYSYDGTNWFGDWDSAAQTVARGVTNLYSWVVANPSYVSTNATGFYVERRFKIVSAANNPTLTFHLGTNFQSHITLSGVSQGSGNAYLAANQTWTGVNTFDQPISGAGTNSLFQASTNAAYLARAQSTNQGSTILTFPAPPRTTVWYAFATNADFAISGFNGIDPYLTNVQTIVMLVTNTAGPTTKVMTLPNGVIKHDGLSCYVTNQGVLTITHYPGLGTNAAFKCLR